MSPRYRTQLGQVRGLGSAKEGVEHWWLQRLTSIALIPLTLWFVTSMVGLTGTDYATAREWLSAPLTVGLMILLVAATFYHARLGLQVILQDYVNPKSLQIAVIVFVDFACLLLALTAILAICVIAFGD